MAKKKKIEQPSLFEHEIGSVRIGPSLRERLRVDTDGELTPEEQPDTRREPDTREEFCSACDGTGMMSDITGKGMVPCLFC